MAKTSPKKNPKLDLKLPDDIKEKTYLTRQVDTSIAILDSPENDVVLESLLFLSRYADIKLNNLNHLQQKGLLDKLLNLFNKNVCILRLSLRLLNVLLSIDTVLVELDQDIYDEKIVEISNLYISHSDLHVKEFCVSILSKLASSCRITSLIFKVDLLNPVLVTIKTTKSLSLLESTMNFFYEMLNTPAALSALPEAKTFDISVILALLNYEDQEISKMAFNIVLRLTSFNLDVFQRMFKQQKLIEKMLTVVMDSEMINYHQIALDIIENCMKSEETCSYFIESMEFLNFCLWVKTCPPNYLSPCVNVLETLSKIPKIKQTLFDLSVEDAILFFLRSTDKVVLNKTCRAISNMSEHKYCCERMLTPTVLKTIVEMLERKDDEEDPENEVALKTISDFMRRSLRTIDLLHSFGSQHLLLEYFKRGNKLTEDSYLRVIEMLHTFSMHPLYQKSIINDKFFGELLKLLESGSTKLATLATEILTYFIDSSDFLKLFLTLSGPRITLTKLSTTMDAKVLKNLLVFIHCILSDENIMLEFLRNNLVATLNNLPNSIKAEAPLIDTILTLTYNLHLPLKLFQTHRLEITDKLKNRFYLINGHWTAPFPFLEILEAQKVSTLLTIYVVDYTYRIANSTTQDPEQSDGPSFRLPDGQFTINYGKLSPDPFLPRYVHHSKKLSDKEECLEGKVRILAAYIDTLLCGPSEDAAVPEKLHQFKLHIESLKQKLGTNMIPVGFLRIGFHCERALLFKAIAEKNCIACSLVKGGNGIYWNEVALLHGNGTTLKFYVVDLMDNIGNLLMLGSREANQYCNLKT